MNNAGMSTAGLSKGRWGQGYHLLAGMMFLGVLLACQPDAEQQGVIQKEALPILGFKEVEANGDTLYHTIPDFQFVDQDSNRITPATFEDKIYIADFFFTSCPTICPRMKAQMRRVYEAYQDHPSVAFLSHSIDPEYDKVPVLKDYATKLNIESDSWHLVTGEKEAIYEIAKSYFENASEDPDEPGGFLHSGAFYLIDQQKRIRGYYNGVDPQEVDQLMADMKLLLHED